MRLQTRPFPRTPPITSGRPATDDEHGQGGPPRPRPRRRGMYTEMVARDVTRNRTITALLVVLMMLAVLLATASAGTLVRLIGASSDLMDRAAAPHVVQMHAGELDEAALERFIAGRPEIEHHQNQLMLGIDGADLSFAGEPQTANIQQNALVVPNAERDLLFDLEDRPITEVEPGTILLPVYYEVEHGLEVGDEVRITAADGFVKELTIAGFARDSIMNPAIASSKRLPVAASDLAEVQAHTGEVEHLIEFWLHDPGSQTASFQAAYLDADTPRAGQMVDSSTFQILTMIGDGMVAAVVVFVSLLLLVVAMLCLRFSFLTAVEQDRREIGVLKAIGVATRDVRRIYLAKYGALAAVASGLGLLGGWLLTPVLTGGITSYMGTSPSVWNVVVPVGVAALILATLVLFVVVLLRRFRKVSAVEALGSATTGQRTSARRLRLHRSRLPVDVRLGAMDIVGRWRTYLLLFAVFAVSAFIVIVPTNSVTTANDPAFINYMGIGAVDLRAELRTIDPDTPERFARAVEQLEADPQVAALAPMVTTRHATVDADGNPASLYVENGDHAELPVRYADGREPRDGSEIALSLLALHQAGREVGDTLPLTVGGQVRELDIVGSYQDITNGGTTAKSALPTGDDEVMWYVLGIDLAEGTDASAAAAAYGDELAPATVADIEQYRAQTLGPIAERLTITAAVAVLVAVALAVLMAGLFVRMLIARDQGPIAIQRAIGADDAGLRLQYLTRILTVLVLGVVVGTVAANTLGETLFNLMFEGMYGGFETLGRGTSRIDFAVQPLLAYAVLPVVLISAVAAATVASCRSIAAADISSLTTE
jgi:putative ABC transport system permease protein